MHQGGAALSLRSCQVTKDTQEGLPTPTKPSRLCSSSGETQETLENQINPHPPKTQWDARGSTSNSRWDRHLYQGVLFILPHAPLKHPFKRTLCTDLRGLVQPRARGAKCARTPTQGGSEKVNAVSPREAEGTPGSCPEGHFMPLRARPEVFTKSPPPSSGLCLALLEKLHISGWGRASAASLWQPGETQQDGGSLSTVCKVPPPPEVCLLARDAGSSLWPSSGVRWVSFPERHGPPCSGERPSLPVGGASSADRQGTGRRSGAGSQGPASLVKSSGWCLLFGSAPPPRVGCSPRANLQRLMGVETDPPIFKNVGFQQDLSRQSCSSGPWPRTATTN